MVIISIPQDYYHSQSIQQSHLDHQNRSHQNIVFLQLCNFPFNSEVIVVLPPPETPAIAITIGNFLSINSLQDFKYLLQQNRTF